LRQEWGEAWGIDPTSILIKTAKKGAPPKAHFRIGDGRRLPFGNERFDVVICQRGPATDNMRFAREMHRVLKKEGTFIAIYIGERDKENIKRIFKRGQFYSEMVNGRTEADRHGRVLNELRFKRIRIRDYDVVEYFPTLDDLVSRFERAPIIPHFHRSRDVRLLRKVEMQIRDKEGLRTNAHRIIVKAVK
jgi:ubiquinone/menaquinone biosynthesis C-methylase UbiE